MICILRRKSMIITIENITMLSISLGSIDSGIRPNLAIPSVNCIVLVRAFSHGFKEANMDNTFCNHIAKVAFNHWMLWCDGLMRLSN